mgnify:CR=1 FL=1
MFDLDSTSLLGIARGLRDEHRFESGRKITFAPRVLLVEQAAKAIIGTKLDETALADLVAAARAAATPISDKRGTAEFRTEVVGVLARRAALIAYARAKGETK